MSAITYVCVNTQCRHRSMTYEHPCPACATPHRKRGESVLVIDLTDEDYNYRRDREALIPQAEKLANKEESPDDPKAWARSFARHMHQLAYDKGLVAYPPY